MRKARLSCKKYDTDTLERGQRPRRSRSEVDMNKLGERADPTHLHWVRLLDTRELAKPVTLHRELGKA